MLLIFIFPISCEGGSSKGKPKPPSSGPYLYCTSVGVLSWEVFINDSVEPIYYVATNKNELILDVSKLGLVPGVHRFIIIPENDAGRGKILEFDLTFVKVKRQTVYEIVLIDAIEAEDPEYVSCFSENLSVIYY